MVGDTSRGVSDKVTVIVISAPSLLVLLITVYFVGLLNQAPATLHPRAFCWPVFCAGQKYWDVNVSGMTFNQ